jgi:RND superfamily putative drug exporter
LLPAVMSLLGEWNWWAPGPLRRWYERWGTAAATAAPTPGGRASAAAESRADQNLVTTDGR